ncbi:alginate export family protein [Roseiconus lacunae]|uniref:alginate export family protein n=1 Tax=Roseiconus lacunae TaxID=2605694 RepID=UPI0011F1BCF3|nr:alginate export family protein [Roseiconus lacunae]
MHIQRAGRQTLVFLAALAADHSALCVASEPPPKIVDAASVHNHATSTFLDTPIVCSHDVGCDGGPRELLGECSQPGCSYRCCLDWENHPETIHKMPRPGIFPIPANGPGYYSAIDCLIGDCRQTAPKSGYAPFAINAWPFFDADWRYVESVPAQERTVVERLKRLRFPDCFLLSTGGEFWTRYAHEHNSRLTDTTNEFTIGHIRQYLDFAYGDSLRVYGEYVWADSWGEDLPSVPPDVDRGDILDLFVDVNLGELAGKPVYVRGGRQELLFGSQRLVTPLPWANKRHSFDGFRVFRQGTKVDFDAFWTKYVPPRATEFDSADDNQTFAGLWGTHRPKKGEFRDLYYLFFDNKNESTSLGINRSPFQTHTVGSRWAGSNEGLLWDFEGAFQFGQQNQGDLTAAMATLGLGKNFGNCVASPTFWIYYDYASGDDDPTSSTSHTFQQQFPFGHYYLGWMDLVGRQNIHDLNAHLYLYPSNWITTWVQYHRFYLAEERDALYNAGGVPYRRDVTGSSGNDVGDEIDLVINFHLTKYSDLLVSYNKLFGGRFLESTAGANQSADAESLYLIFQQRW